MQNELLQLYAKLETLAKESEDRLARVRGTGQSVYNELLQSALPDPAREQTLYIASTVRPRPTSARPQAALRQQQRQEVRRVVHTEYLVDMAVAKPFVRPSLGAQTEVKPVNGHTQALQQSASHHATPAPSPQGHWIPKPSPPRLVGINAVPIVRQRPSPSDSTRAAALRDAVRAAADLRDDDDDLHAGESHRVAHGSTSTYTAGGPTIRTTFVPESCRDAAALRALMSPSTGGGAAHHPRRRPKSAASKRAPAVTVLRRAEDIWDALEAADDPDRLETYAFTVTAAAAHGGDTTHAPQANQPPAASRSQSATGRAAGSRPTSARPAAWRTVPWTTLRPAKVHHAPLAVKGEKVEVPSPLAVPASSLATHAHTLGRPSTAPAARRDAPASRPVSASAGRTIKRPGTAARTRGAAAPALVLDPINGSDDDFDLGQVIRDSTVPSP